MGHLTGPFALKSLKMLLVQDALGLFQFPSRCPLIRAATEVDFSDRKSTMSFKIPQQYLIGLKSL